MSENCDILIAGGGIAGLCAAMAFGAEGWQVILVDPAPPVTERDVAGSDLRTTALLQPSRDVLDQIGLWDRLAPHATPLEVMRIVETADPPVHREFSARDISDDPFGWNLPNWLLRKVIVAALADQPTVDFRPGTGATALFTRSTGARVTLSDGTKVTAQLVIAADGRTSKLRDLAGISTKTHRFGQTALSFAVSHPEPHHNVSTEVHRSGGPFTLVPLPDQDGEPSSAVVWMEPHAEAQRLAALDVAEFEGEATARSLSLHGPLTLLTRRDMWPILTRTADRFVAERLALVAEAAHAVPPIGAQGLNMSLADIAELRSLMMAAPDQIGAPELLETYNRRRRASVQLRAVGVSVLNHFSIAQGGPLRALRGPGLQLLHDVTPVRQGLMRLGLGTMG